VLFDPYAFAPLRRAGDLDAGEVPGGIDEDFAVYFDDQGRVVGFRSRGGQFYTAAGEEAEAAEIIEQRSGQVERAFDAVGVPVPISEAFRDAPTRALVLPRLGASVEVGGGAAVHLFYNGLAQAPPAALAFPSLVDLEEVSFGEAIPSAALRPERAVDIGGGLRQRVGAGVAEVAGFYRRYRDLVGLFAYEGGFPGYTGYASAYGATVYGATASVDVRAGRLDALVSATLSREPVFFADRFTFLYDRHDAGTSEAVWRPSLSAAAAYRLPSFGAPVVFDGVHLGGVLQARGGQPYRERSQGGTFYELTGEIGRAPAFVQLDLRAEKAVGLDGGAELAAALWVENVLGRENVLAVYPGSGRPDDPADPSFPLFLDAQEPAFRAAAEAQYALLARNPAFFGRPRQLRLGLALRY
jgi:hypothetical protein